MYPSPGHSLLSIPHPGHAGNGTAVAKISISSISISVIFGAISVGPPFTNGIDSLGTFARVVASHQPDSSKRTALTAEIHSGNLSKIAVTDLT